MPGPSGMRATRSRGPARYRAPHARELRHEGQHVGPGGGAVVEPALEQLDVEQGDAQVVGRPSSQPGDQIVAAPGDQSVDGVQRQACVHALAQAQSLCGVVGERRLPLQAVGLQTRRGEALESAATEPTAGRRGMPARGAAYPGDRRGGAETKDPCDVVLVFASHGRREVGTSRGSTSVGV